MYKIIAIQTLLKTKDEGQLVRTSHIIKTHKSFSKLAQLLAAARRDSCTVTMLTPSSLHTCTYAYTHVCTYMHECVCAKRRPMTPKVMPIDGETKILGVNSQQHGNRNGNHHNRWMLAQLRRRCHIIKYVNKLIIIIIINKTLFAIGHCVCVYNLNAYLCIVRCGAVHEWLPDYCNELSVSGSGPGQSSI